LWLEQLEQRDMLAASSGLLDPGQVRLQPGHYDPTHILVWYAPDVTPTTDLAGTTIDHALDLVQGLYEVDLAPGISVTQALAAYRAAPGVQDALPDYLLTIQNTPNDTFFSNQWDMRKIQAPEAWSYATGSSNIVVAVIDTGIDYDHPDLYQNIWINQAEIPPSRRANLTDVDGDGIISFKDLNNPINQGPGKITDMNGDGRIDAADILAPMILNAQGKDTGLGGWADGSTEDGDTAHPDDLIGWNFIANDNTPMDDNGHGTHVSGTIGAMGDNGRGIAGINWNVSLMPIKFMNSAGQGDLGAFLDGLSYAVDHGARLANNSWVGFGQSAYLRQMVSDAISQAGSHGLIFVAAAGNGGHSNDINPVYPASFALNNVVSVAATNYGDSLASFSDWGATTVDLAAPGMSIYSTLPGGRYGYMSGTSMATPHVTGALALVWSVHPSWTYQQVIDQVLNTVDRLPGLAHKTVSGGRLNLARALGLTSTTYTSTQQLAIPDLSQVSSAITVSASSTITAVQVQVNITHTFDSDLVLVLISPSGTEVILSNRRGGAGHNYTNTLFEDSAATSISKGQAPFAGSYQPEQPLQGLKGQNAQGVWKLQVEDEAQGNVGTLNSWSLTVIAAS